MSVHEVHLYLNASPTRVSQMREETDKDTILSALREVIIYGWPKKDLIDLPIFMLTETIAMSIL